MEGNTNWVSFFEIKYEYDGYKVDLYHHTCTCKLWMVSGIPCVHGQVAINSMHKNLIEFISPWFRKDKLIPTYMENALLVGGSNMWQRTNFIKPLPPLVRRMPGRPKVYRRKHASES